MPVDDRPAGGEQIAEMHRILHKLLERERLTATEIDFLRVLHINALEHFRDGR